MTDDIEETKPRSRRSSSVPPPPILEEQNSTSTISELYHSNPLIDPDAATVASRNSNTPRTRRRSSISILQALVSSSHLLPTNDARKR
jgi:hypothetical protein